MGRPSREGQAHALWPLRPSLFNKQIMKCCEKRLGGGLSSALRPALFCKQSLHSAARSGSPQEDRESLSLLGLGLSCGRVL